MKKSIVLWIVLMVATAAGAGQWSLEGAFDFETVDAELLRWLDPNGGVGLLMLGDSSVPGDWQENLAVGPVAQFRLDPIYHGVLGLLMPWLEVPADLPATFWGKVGAGIEFGGDHDLVGVVATGVRLGDEERRVQPTIWLERIQPEGSAGIEPETRLLFGVTVWLGK